MFLCTGTYELPGPTGPASHTLSRHLGVHSIAEYYDLPTLKSLATRNICHLLWKADDMDAQGFFRAVDQAFVNTWDESLHSVMKDYAVRKCEDLFVTPSVDEIVEANLPITFMAYMLKVLSAHIVRLRASLARMERELYGLAGPPPIWEFWGSGHS